MMPINSDASHKSDNDNLSETLTTDQNIINLWKQTTVVIFVITVLFIVSACYLLLKQFSALEQFFAFFSSIDNVTSFLETFNEKYGVIGFLPLFGGLTYFYLMFIVIDRAGISALTFGDSDSKTLGLLLLLLKMFNFVGLIFLLIYLANLGSYFECAVLILFFLFSKYTIVPLMNTSKNILFNYDLLTSLAQDNVLSEPAPTITVANVMDTMKSPFNPVTKRIIHIFLKSFNLYLSAIIILTVVLGYFGMLLRFNLFSILYIELSLLFCYLVIHIVAQLLNKGKVRVNIHLTSGGAINNVFIIDEIDPNSYVYLERSEETGKSLLRKIMKNSISQIEPAEQ